MIKNSKYFIAPQKSSETFKVLFARLAAEGAGRPIDENGFPDGPWTPEKLADEISAIDANPKGIEVRAVQVWFQDNDNGISNDNIRWLARIFGCDDPEATSQWQAELTAARERLANERRTKRKLNTKPNLGTYNLHGFPAINQSLPNTGHPKQEVCYLLDEAGLSQPGDTTLPVWGTKDSLIRRSSYTERQRTGVVTRVSWMASISERMFLGGAPFGVIMVLWAFVALLLFTSLILGVHDITYNPIVGVTKQVGLFWSPNWIIDRLVWLPLLVIFVSNILTCWRDEWRPTLLSESPELEVACGWQQRLTTYSYSFWGITLVSVLIIFLLQWYGGYLRPLLQNDVGNRVVDWLLVSIERPEMMTVRESIFVSMVANFISGVGYWFSFAGLMLLYIISADFKDVSRRSAPSYDHAQRREAFSIAAIILQGVYCSAVFMILASLGIKLVSIYLMTDAENIVEWLRQDALTVFGMHSNGWDWFDKNPTSSITSFFVLFIPCFVFCLCLSQIYTSLQRMISEGPNVSRKEEIWAKTELTRLQSSSLKWIGVIVLLVANFWLIGRFSGFSALLLCSLTIAIYSIVVSRRILADEGIE